MVGTSLRAFAHPTALSSSRIRIDQLLLLGTVLHEHVDEGPDLRRQMVLVRIDRVH